MNATDLQRAAGKQRLRWYQYSLRTLLLVMLLASVGMSWVAVRFQRAREQQRAVKTIKEVGGWADHVDYDFEEDESGNYLPDAQPPQPVWLRSLLGDDFFCDVVLASVSTDAAVQQIRHLHGLKTAWIWSTDVTDAALRHVESCSQLEALHLRHTGITDAGLIHLQGLSRLQHLDVQDTKVTDAGLEHLKSLRCLESLDIRLNKITDAGLKHLKALPSLQLLLLFGTQVTDEGVAEFQKAMPQCTVDRESWIAL